jgi:S1-C subfamily serine protease
LLSHIFEKSISGQSGGPFYDEDGEIVGIAIANARNEETGEIFPRVNMAIPIYYINNILEQFATSNGK